MNVQGEARSPDRLGISLLRRRSCMVWSRRVPANINKARRVEEGRESFDSNRV